MFFQIQSSLLIDVNFLTMCSDQIGDDCIFFMNNQWTWDQQPQCSESKSGVEVPRQHVLYQTSVVLQGQLSCIRRKLDPICTFCMGIFTMLVTSYILLECIFISLNYFHLPLWEANSRVVRNAGIRTKRRTGTILEYRTNFSQLTQL